VEFYSRRCGYCVQLAPVWKQLAENMGSHVEICSVDCELQASLCGRYQVRGYPSLKMFGLSEADDKRYILDYEGAREFDSLAAYAKRHATSLVYQLRPQVSTKDRSGNKRIVTADEFLAKVYTNYSYYC